MITDELCLTAASVGGECELSEMAVESYGDAVLSAAREKSFPSEMPWALADTLRDDFILD
ncbi:hypothetical protein NDU61_001461 [Salmonella enterica]|nr:hypothetical protein [Salmonella enterica]